jgi:xanthine dehydrogenase YagT iron-sulfur-binding subunit
MGSGGVSRRSFMKSVGLSAAAAQITHAAQPTPDQANPDNAKPDNVKILGPDPIDITLSINAKKYSAKMDPATTLLMALRLHFGLTGAKEVCDRAACGACSVLLDGKLVTACMILAIDAVGSEVTTVEGLAKDGTLDPVQLNFVRHDGMQCGFCTPGFVMASRWLLDHTPKPTLEQIRHALSGNICRCGTYPNIFNAVLEASGQSPLVDAQPL